MLDAEKVKEMLSTEDIIRLCHDLQGDDTDRYDFQGHPVFSTSICHGGNSPDKLYYYPDSKLLHCWTCGETKDIFEIVKFCKGFTEFYDAFKFVVDYFGIKDEDDREEVELTDDWDIFQKYKDLEVSTNNITEKFVNENILEYWPKASPEEWIKDHISEEAMDRYGIRVDSANRKIIIPHRDDNGNLVGIRGRAYDLEEMQRAKYAPVYLNNVLYNFPTGQYLYGLWQNKYGIQRTKKVLLCEGEKSVLQYASYYPPEDCICLATCGSNITQAQIDLLLKYGVEEVILGYDRDFDTYKGDPETKAYEEKLRKILQPLLPYFRVYVIMDYEHITGYKCSCTDCGKDIYEQLYNKRMIVKMDNKNNVVFRGLK